MKITVEEAKKIMRSIGLCLCGHFETCSVCTRSDTQRDFERKCAAFLRKKGCGVKWEHDWGYARICRLCWAHNPVEPIKMAKPSRLLAIYNAKRRKK